MNIKRIVQAAIPNAEDWVIEHVIWGRTHFPFAPVSAQMLYKAASSLQRATANGKQLCEFCHRLAESEKTLCARCRSALDNSLK